MFMSQLDIQLKCIQLFKKLVLLFQLFICREVLAYNNSLKIKMSKKEAKYYKFDMFDDDDPLVNTSGMYFIEFEWRVFKGRKKGSLLRASFYLDNPNTTSYTNAHVCQSPRSKRKKSSCWKGNNL